MSKNQSDISQSSSSILIVGGTTEGRIVVETCDDAGKIYYYSTKNASQQVDCVHGVRVSGGLDKDEMMSFCSANDVRLIIDAAHPFAMNVHRNVGDTAEAVNIPVIRFERKFPERDSRLHWFGTYDEAISYLEHNKIHRLLALTGVNTIKSLRKFWQSNPDTYFRIMNRTESLAEVQKEAFPLSHILFYDQEPDDRKLFAQIDPQAIITKESGDTGGFSEKVQTALDLDIPVLVIKRPDLPYTPQSVVYGKHGLRRAIEQLLPHFYDLKTGYTTGTCATAATAAALTTLLTGQILEEVTIMLPNDEPITIPLSDTDVSKEGVVRCTVLKYSGDDPDVTKGTEICSTVALNPNHSDILFLQGVGVGKVTLPGLGLEVGGPAINNTPRMMMKKEVMSLLLRHGEEPHVGVDVTISVPKGEELAKLTFNPKLGIIGGISIIGTSGIVKPFSSEAFVNSIRAEVRVARSMGVPRLVINSGAKSEKYLKALYPDLPQQAFVHYGNFIGETVKAASDEGFEHLTMGIMIGKAVKLAEGYLDTHSKKTLMNKEFIQSLARQSECSDEQIKSISEITLAREIWHIIPPKDRDGERTSPFYTLLAQKCHEVCAPLLPHGLLTVYLITETGELIK
ncbi:cobalt-precorrin-5B (C(1))-methyltransferase CbiD [Porphyromonas sp.]|uniref:cobalt-precorrin-5B (C(1))-methyltransferase CbiD n=1 Tax=Porphyromonas sp. TaxID=1924944 RepID=UPI0026DB7774|nr:cobalt-precorrin-5B (C(1))-methyltransferase CbiD [Porphyromonas sp.]MDO4771805.1 cobalt-precorrin-5B (C(1))-methyltransferase CbiD [Porphyromonas sp.]